MQLERLIAALAPTDVVGDGALEIRELAYDAREVPRDSLFFCVPGGKADGHDFAAEALERGAAALVVERRLELEAPQLVVPSVRAAMPRAAVAFFEDPTARLPVAAITGTNGKTTTAYLLWSILSAAGEQPGLLTNVERRVGTEVREVVPGNYLVTGAVLWLLVCRLPVRRPFHDKSCVQGSRAGGSDRLACRRRGREAHARPAHGRRADRRFRNPFELHIGTPWRHGALRSRH